MLVGHHAVGFAAKRAAPRVSLGTLQVACVFPDLLVFVNQLIGLEHARITPGITAFSGLDGYDVAISHSLATSVAWAAFLPWSTLAGDVTVAVLLSSRLLCSAIGYWTSSVTALRCR